MQIGPVVYEKNYVRDQPFLSEKSNFSSVGRFLSGLRPLVRSDTGWFRQEDLRIINFSRYFRVDGTGCNQTDVDISSRYCDYYNVREVTNCGAAITSLEDMRNATCQVNLAYPYKTVYAGNGAFIVESNYIDQVN